MNPANRQLYRNLLNLLRDGHSASELFSSSEQETCDVETLMARLPDNINEELYEIVVAFEQLRDENEQFNREILSSYDHLNSAFNAAVAVAACREVRTAVQVLTEQIGNAIDAAYGYYVGKLALSFPRPRNEVPGNGAIILFDTISSPGENFSNAKDFFINRAENIEYLLTKGDDLEVAMIDYQGRNELDHEGRGNVLKVKLSGDDKDMSSSGDLIFVREKDQEPFMAVEMNLAGSIGCLGSAVLGNIIYAQKLHRTSLQMVSSLVRAMEAKDKYTSGHSERVARIACHLARELGLDDDQIKTLEWAGLLHDVGKIGVRDDVLSKAGRLSEEEFEHIKTHPAQSYNVLEPLETLRHILRAVRHHHEHYDGTGYPDGLFGEDIPLMARILQIADVWDALTSTRSYRKAMSPQKAMQIMNDEAGTIMDPYLVEVFNEMMQNSNYAF
ncbi:MAG: HD-GYP domain-containing protein [Sedimentisphaerales bacterium]|nr:HD-GYP domain-containing protein [Sedimentisphaerales bacterium]